MKAVIAHFIVDPKQDERCAGHTNGKSRNIYKGEPFAAQDVAQGDLEMVSQHGVEISVRPHSFKASANG